MHTHTRTSQTLLGTHAAALVSWAQKNAQFATELYAITHAITPADSQFPKSPGTWVMPADDEAALQRARWLVCECTKRPLHTTTAARSLLTTWRSTYEDTQDVVLGIVGVAIIGPTLGLVKKKKKKKSVLRIACNTAIKNSSRAKIAAYAQHASLQLLSSELATVGGNAYRLDPELAEWLFTDQTSRLFTLDETELINTAQWLTDNHLPHALYKEGDRAIALAVSPCVSETLDLGSPM